MPDPAPASTDGDVDPSTPAPDTPHSGAPHSGTPGGAGTPGTVLSVPQRAALGLLALIAVALASPWSARAEVFVYKDAEGVVHFTDTPRHTGFQVHTPVLLRPSREESAREDGADDPDDRFDVLITRAGRTHRLSPGLVKAVIHAESRFDPYAVSHKGARGLMQLMPATAGELGVRDAFNPWQNIEGGTRYLAMLVAQFDGDLRLGLAAYHAGPGRVRRHGGMPPFPITRKYVDRVLKLYERYHADFR
jgi:soluble lytic murein transglycosylase-like protein